MKGLPLFRYLPGNTTFEGFGASPMTLILKGAVKKMDRDYKNNGNLEAVPILIEGWTVEDVETKLTGVLCGHRPASCAKQLAKAVRAAYEAERQAS